MEHKLEDVVRKIMASSFPELSDISVNLEVGELPDAHVQYSFLNFKKIRMEFDEDILKAPQSAVDGCVAHELAHISLDLKIPYLIRSLEILIYTACKRYNTYVERKADTLAVQRGYGNELIAFIRWANENYDNFNSREGLLIREIRNLIKVNSKDL